MAIMQMNTGLALGSIVLASQNGQTQNLPPVSQWLGRFKVKGLNAAVSVSKYLGTDSLQQAQGSDIAPFKTIKAAVVAMGPVKTLAGYEQPRTLNIMGGGSYAVSDVTLPMGRWIINLFSGAKLTGALKLNMAVAEAFGSIQAPGIVINNVDGSPVESGLDSVAFVQGTGAPVVSAFVVGRDALFDTLVTGPATLLSIDCQLERCSIKGTVLATAMNLKAFDCGVSRDITCKQIDDDDGFFGGNITVTSGSEFRQSRFNTVAKTFTGPGALSLRIDGDANFSFKVAPWLLGGGATKLIITDLVP